MDGIVPVASGRFAGYRCRPVDSVRELLSFISLGRQRRGPEPTPLCNTVRENSLIISVVETEVL
jgi:hypothetical protein